MSQDVFQLWMDAILEQCPGVIGILDDMVIFGVDQEDHDANLINLLNLKMSQVAKEPLQPHDIPEGPWRKLGMVLLREKALWFKVLIKGFIV